MELPKPDLKVEGDKLAVELNLLQVDLDGDGVKSAELKLSAMVDKAEGAQEILSKLMASDKVPAIIKQLLGLK